MPTVSFKMSDIAVIAEHARTSKEKRLAFDQQFDEDLWKDGFKGKQLSDDQIMFELKGSHIDQTKVPAGFWLVKDNGVLLMSNGTPMLKREDKDESVVVYAKGFNPETDDFAWEKGAQVFGGSDCVIFIPLDWYDLAKQHNKRTLSIRVNKNSIALNI